jgi:hypothetical protein
VKVWVRDLDFGGVKWLTLAGRLPDSAMALSPRTHLDRYPSHASEITDSISRRVHIFSYNAAHEMIYVQKRLTEPTVLMRVPSD